jgi:hypothetical protein
MSTRACFAIAVAAALFVVAGTGTAGQQLPPPPTMPPASDFVGEIDNPYLPLEPGTTFVYRGTRDGEPERNKVVVTHDTKTILGVRATVVFDRVWVSGQLEEKTFDWVAQDKAGNVWYLGEDSFDFVDGKWVRSDGSWEAGVDGAQPGILMEAHPKVGDVYRQEYYAGHAEDVAKVLSMRASVRVPFGSFDNVLKTKEWTPLEPDVSEHKYYAAGVGNVRTVTVKGGQGELELVSVRQRDDGD